MSSNKDILPPEITKDTGAIHPINHMKDSIMSLLVSFGFEIIDGPEIETEEFNLFPSTFLIGLAKHLGVQPLIENKENKWLDLKTGVIGGVRDTDTISVEGNMVDIVLSTMENKQPFVKLDKKQRTDLLGAIITYYKIHVPGFSEPSTYEIVQEILA